MKIELKPDSSIQEIKTVFHSFFPYLKLEFFRESHRVSAASGKASMYDNSTLLSEMSEKIGSGSIEFTAATTVGSFEQLMDVQFGLHVQVFRKSGNVYLETSSTDSWSLGQQNAEGLASSKEPADDQPLDLLDRDKWE